MKRVPAKRSLLHFYEELVYTEAALSADEETTHLAEPYEKALEDWLGTFEKERAARREVVRSEARVRVKDQTLDRHTRTFSGVALSEANLDRSSTLFRRFFPIPPSEFVRQGLGRQAELTQNVILAELAKLPEGSRLKTFIAPIEKAVNAVIEALSLRGRARAGRGSSSHDIDEWKEGVNKLRLATYGDLIKFASEKNYGKIWADTFFRVDVHEEEAPEEEPAPQPVEA